MSNRMRQVHRATRQGWLESVMRGTSEPIPVQKHPAQGKDYRDMTVSDLHAVCACGVSGAQHLDGWTGAWIGCEEARRRNGR